MNHLKHIHLKISKINYTIILNKITVSIKSKKKLIILYANASTFVKLKKKSELLKALNEADIVFPDGIGVWLSSKILGVQKVEKFNWTDYAYDFLEISQQRKWKLFFIGSTDEILEKSVKNLKLKFPSIKIVGWLNGYSDIKKIDVIQKINNAKPDIIWVGMGTPKQELWINQNKNNLQCYVIQAVGDIFSLLAREKIRGPKILQRMGFEWLFRLIAEPKRFWKRYILGIPIFFFLIIKEKITASFYRKK